MRGGIQFPAGNPVDRHHVCRHRRHLAEKWAWPGQQRRPATTDAAWYTSLNSARAFF